MAQAGIVEVAVRVDEPRQQRVLAEIGDLLAGELTPQILPAADRRHRVAPYEHRAVGDGRSVHGHEGAGAQEHGQSK